MCVGRQFHRFCTAAGAMAGMLLAGEGICADDLAVRFTLDRQFDGPSAPFLAALQKGYYKEEGLAVSIDTGYGSRESVPRVASGAYQFGFGDINFLIKFRDRNPDLDVKAIMMAYDIPPFAIIGRKSMGISGRTDLEGKTLGATPPDAAFVHWPSFAEVNNIDSGKIEIESLGYALREEALALGEVDGIFGSSLSSAVDLKSKGVPAEDIAVILMSQNGLDLYGNAVIVNPEFAKENPEAVKGFVKATLRGFLDTIADPSGNIEAVLDRNNSARRSVEAERLRMAVNDNIATDWVRANGLGGVDMARLARSIDQLAIVHDFSTSVKAEDVFTEAYLPPKQERMLP